MKEQTNLPKDANLIKKQLLSLEKENNKLLETVQQQSVEIGELYAEIMLLKNSASDQDNDLSNIDLDKILKIKENVSIYKEKSILLKKRAKELKEEHDNLVKEIDPTREESPQTIIDSELLNSIVNSILNEEELKNMDIETIGEE